MRPETSPGRQAKTVSSPREPERGRHPGPPDDIDPLGVPREGGAHDAFVMTAAIVVALLALTFTLGWIVYHQLTAG